MRRSTLHIALLLVVAVGALVLRLVQLDRRPMHNDEANQAYRCGLLLDSGLYEYDPHEHHGPTLYYLTLPVAWLSGSKRFADTSEWTFRLVPVLFGVLLIPVLLLLRDGVGWPSVLGAALFTAVSPAMVYYSRFYIQETLLVFFTFGTIAAGWRYAQTRKVGWLVAAGVCAGLMHATKETCVIAFVAMAAACLITRAVVRADGETLLPALNLRHALAGLAAAALTSVLLFSSFLTHARGPLDSVLTYVTYLRRAGGEGLHVHPSPFYYLGMLTWSRYGRGPVWTEALILALAAVGVIVTIVRAARFGEHNRLTLFLSVYAVLLTAAYSVIPYKTPWCMLSFLQALIVLAGVGAWEVIRASRHPVLRSTVLLILVLGTWHLAGQAGRASFRYSADPRNPYVYAQTGPDFLRLVSRVADISKVHPAGRDMFVQVIAAPRATWPLPWYLRAYTRVGYWTAVADVPDAADVPLVIASADMEEALRDRVGDRYLTEYYGLRPNVLLAAYIRRDLWGEFMRGR